MLFGKIKINFLLWFLSFHFFTVFSQSSFEGKEKNELNIIPYLNMGIPSSGSIEESVALDSNTDYVFGLEGVDLIHPGIGIKITNPKKWYQEYGLMALHVKRDYEATFVKIQNDDDFPKNGKNRLVLETMLGIEYGKLFVFDGVDNFLFGLALGINPYMNYLDMEPVTSAEVPVSLLKIGGEFSIVPRIEIKVLDRLGLFFKIPVGITDFYYKKTKAGIPFSFNAINEATFETEFGIKTFRMSFGLGCRI